MIEAALLEGVPDHEPMFGMFLLQRHGRVRREIVRQDRSGPGCRDEEDGQPRRKKPEPEAGRHEGDGEEPGAAARRCGRRTGMGGRNTDRNRHGQNADHPELSSGEA